MSLKPDLLDASPAAFLAQAGFLQARETVCIPLDPSYTHAELRAGARTKTRCPPDAHGREWRSRVSRALPGARTRPRFIACQGLSAYPCDQLYLSAQTLPSARSSASMAGEAKVTDPSTPWCQGRPVIHHSDQDRSTPRWRQDADRPGSDPMGSAATATTTRFESFFASRMRTARSQAL